MKKPEELEDQRMKPSSSSSQDSRRPALLDAASKKTFAVEKKKWKADLEDQFFFSYFQIKECLWRKGTYSGSLPSSIVNK